MALKIYGVARSRAFRTLWMAAELGLDYEHVKLDFADGSTRQPAYLAINPNGHVPAIDDDGFKLWESMAINLYLAKKYGGAVALPAAPRRRGARLAMELLGDDRNRAAGADRDVESDRSREQARRRRSRRGGAGASAPLKVLDGAVAATPFLLGDHFTVADLNVASILSWARQARIDLPPFRRPKPGSSGATTAPPRRPPGICSGNKQLALRRRSLALNVGRKDGGLGRKRWRQRV